MQKQMPGLLWVSIVSLGIMMLGNLGGGVIQLNYFAIVVGVVDGVLIWGIIKAFRWAFWVVTVLVFGGLICVMFIGNGRTIAASAVLDTFLFVPVFVCRKYFLFR